MVVTGNNINDITNSRVLVDNIAENSGSILNSGGTTSKTVFRIGRNQSFFSNIYLDNLRIYNRVLSTVEISEIYNKTKSKYQ